jgi:hypothetical protein
MDEITKEAIERAKAKAGKTKMSATKETETNVESKSEVKPETKVEKTNSQEKPEKLQLNQFDLGSKVVTIKPWNGKTKKKMRKIFENVENPEDIDFFEVIKTLIYDYIKEDVFLNEGDIQFLLAKIRNISISEDVNMKLPCPNCGEQNKITGKTDSFIEYKKNELPKTYNDDIEFVEIESLEFFEDIKNDILNSEDYDGITTQADIEIALHIKMKDKGVKEVIDYLDELAIKESAQIIESLRDSISECKIQTEKECKSCRNKAVFNIDLTESIFTDLLK